MLEERSKTLIEIFNDYVDKDDSILEIGSGDGRNIRFLKEAGYTKIEGVDKLYGKAIEDIEPKEYNVIYTMSTLFLIPPENDWVFKKIAGMAKKYIITLEGETTDFKRNVWGRDYNEVFSKFGFEQIEYQKPIFNEYGVLRVFKRYGKS